MTYLRCAFWAQDYSNDIETQRLIVDSVLFEEMISGAGHSFAFVLIDGKLCGCEIFITAGFYFDKYDSALRVGGDQIDLTECAAIVAGDCFKAFGFEELLAAPFPPDAQPLRISKEPLPVEGQSKHLIRLPTWSRCDRCDAEADERLYRYVL